MPPQNLPALSARDEILVPTMRLVKGAQSVVYAG
jgi:hypothetical protein